MEDEEQKSNYNEETTIFLPFLNSHYEESEIINDENSDEIGKKCGEIFQNKDNVFNYLCTICGKIVKGFEEFITHIKIDHNDYCKNITILDEPQININNEEIIDIKNLHKNDNFSNIDIKIENSDKNDVENTLQKINTNLQITKRKRIRKRYRKTPCVTCKLCNNKFTSQLYLVSHLKYDHVEPNPFLKTTIDNQLELSSCDDDGDNLDKNDNNDDDKNDNNDDKKTSIDRKQKITIKELDKSILDDPFKCRYCGKRFRGRMKRFEHECLHTGDKPFKCDICDMCFRKKCGLDSHLPTHNEGKPFKCNICNETYKQKKYLKNHILLHNGNNKKYKCNYCDKTFSRGNNRKVHERIHTKEKPYQCTKCGICFVSSSGLHKHNRKHTGLKSHKCKYCDKAYVEFSDKKNHEKIHIGDRPYVCKICDARYTTYRGLKLHIKCHPELTENDIISYKHKLFTVTKTKTTNTIKNKEDILISLTSSSSKSLIDGKNEKNTNASTSTLYPPTIENTTNKQLSSSSSLYPITSEGQNSFD